MSDPEKNMSGEPDSVAKYEAGKLKVDHVGPVHVEGGDANRNFSVATNGGRQYSTGGDRRMSQWDAIKIAKAGGVEVDEEIELLEEELRNNPIKTNFFSPVINFKDPRHFTSAESFYVKVKTLTVLTGGFLWASLRWVAFFQVLTSHSYLGPIFSTSFPFFQNH